MSKEWFTSDTHFGSERTLQLSKRPFKSVEEMDVTIIRNWNSIVSEDDIVYHLGDFGNYEIVKKLNGKIKLFCGNYEMDSIGCSIEDLKKIIDEDNFNELNNSILDIKRLEGTYGFNKVLYNCGNPYNINIDGLGKVSISHRPKDCTKTLFGLFGHIHKLQMVKIFGLNVGVDCHNYFPIDVNTILYYKNAIENIYDENVFL